jgi:hypothetical protein
MQRNRPLTEAFGSHHRFSRIRGRQLFPQPSDAKIDLAPLWRQSALFPRSAGLRSFVSLTLQTSKMYRALAFHKPDHL